MTEWLAGKDLSNHAFSRVFRAKRLAAEMLGLPTDDEYEWEELADAFEARERPDGLKQSERTNWRNEGF